MTTQPAPKHAALIARIQVHIEYYESIYSETLPINEQVFIQSNIRILQAQIAELEKEHE